MIDEHRRRVLRMTADSELTIESQIRLERDVAQATTHAALYRIADELDAARAIHEEEELFGQ